MTARARRDAPLVFHLIPHTHWDREWYLGAAAFTARLVPMLDDLLDRLERDPSYRTFLLDGQTVLLRDYLTVRPEREPLVRRMVGDGRLQTGPWYVLADEQIPSGESLVRNLLIGRYDAERWGGRLDVLYAPDTFGHPAALPMLAREFGMVHGALWRGLAPARTHGRDVVHWAGPDGRDVMLYHLPRDGYEVGAALPADAELLTDAWPPLRRELVSRAATRHVAVLVGADHHAAHPDLPALRDALAAMEAGNEVRISRLDDFLGEVSGLGSRVSGPAPRDEGVEPIAATGTSRDPRPETRDSRLRAITGELRDSYGYTWTLQGVHATRTPQKRRNSDLELLLERGAEPLAALAAVHGGRDERPLLRDAWRRMVECHFHDSIAGCASDDVARAVDTRFDAVAGIAPEIVRRALFTLAGHDPDRARADSSATTPALLLWNPVARSRRGIVVADLTFFRRDVKVGPPSDGAALSGTGTGAARRRAASAPLALTVSDGSIIPVQVLDRSPALERVDAPRHYPDLDEVERVRVAFEAPEVPGLAIARLGLAPRGAPAPERELRRAGRSIANRFVEVTVEPHGSLTLVDRLSGERYTGLLAWEDEDDIGDTYTPCPAPEGGVMHPAGDARVRDLAAGPYVASLEVRTALAAGRTPEADGSGWVDIRMVVMLFADDPAVRIRIELVNAAQDHRLRLRLSTGLAGSTVTAGTTFGIVRRDAEGHDLAASHERREPLRAADGVWGERPPLIESRVRTAPAHRFVAASEGSRGLALLAPGFFEYEWTAQGDLLFTALRAVGMLSRDDLPTRPGHAGWTMPVPAAQLLGDDHFDLALVPAGAAMLERPDELMAIWEDCFLPIRPMWLRMASLDPGVPRAIGIELDGAGLVLSAVKPAEEGSGIVLRCCNLLDRPAPGTWRTAWDLHRAARMRADEREPEEIALTTDRRTVRFTAPARGVVTILVDGG